jgi:hypothetical protein
VRCRRQKSRCSKRSASVRTATVNWLQTRLREIEAVGASARLAHDRLANFQIKIGADYQCPGCWIEHERRSSLTPVGGGTATEEFFTCHVYHFGIAIPIPR